jgi:multisubunit Na+/H+ antiporter MnhB subunit
MRSDMTPRAVRRVVIAVFVLGIAGMIAFSIADNNGGALTSGLLTAAASLCLMVATAVTPKLGDDTGEELESRIGELVAQGADEGDVRALVREAIAFGRTADRAR